MNALNTQIQRYARLGGILADLDGSLARSIHMVGLALGSQ